MNNSGQLETKKPSISAGLGSPLDSIGLEIGGAGTLNSLYNSFFIIVIVVTFSSDAPKVAPEVLG